MALRRSFTPARIRTAAIAAGFALMTVSGAAHGAPSGNEGEARARYSRGVELYNEGAYAASLIELERAHVLSPHYTILHSIGLVKIQLADFVGALNAFEEYLTASGDEISVARKTEVREKVQQLRERIATLDISVTVDGAEVLVDGNVIGIAPLPKPVLVNPGRHEITARRPGETGETKTVSAAGTDKLKLVFELNEPEERTRTIVTVAPSRPKWVTWTWIATGVLAAGAVTTGIIASSEASSLDDNRRNRPTSANDLDSQSSNVKTFALVTDILGASAIVLGAVSLYYTLKGGGSSTEPATDTKAATTTSGVKANFRLGLGGADIVGQF